MPRKTQAERRQETREKLIDASIHILIKRGYANFRVAEVAAVSGVSHGGMIHHYPSKDALIAGVLDHILERLRSQTEVRMDKAKDQKSALIAIVDSGKQFFFGTDFPIYLDLTLATRQGGSLPKTARALARRHRELIEEFWASSLERFGSDAQISRDVVSLIWTVMRGLGIRAIGETNFESYERTIDFALMVVLQYIGKKATHPGARRRDP